jgi:hypothetical protein
MIPEQYMQQAQRRIHHAEVVTSEAARLRDIAGQLMAVQRQWSHPDREAHLTAALAASRDVWNGIQSSLAEGVLDVPLEVRHNLLILSVYAESKISACEATPDATMLGSLVALTRTLAGSLKEWRVAA